MSRASRVSSRSKVEPAGDQICTSVSDIAVTDFSANPPERS